MNPAQILESTRAGIKQCSGGDPDKWFYANRYVFARLQLDERKTKTGIKRQLIDSQHSCAYCGKPIDSKLGLHLHRIDESRGYSLENCALMHRDCHERHHAERGRRENMGAPEETTHTVSKSAVVKRSKRYEDGPFLYWWDISPTLGATLDRYDAVDFVQKDTGERCSLPPEALKGFLTADRQTSRANGPWGIKVLKDRPEELAFEPGRGGGDWLFLSVVWLTDEED